MPPVGLTEAGFSKGELGDQPRLSAGPLSADAEPTVAVLRSSRVRELYLQFDPDPVFAHLHLPDQLAHATIGVVICAPFGWDELCSYRSRRWLAEALADAGHVAVRIDLPGTGDSGGSPRGPARLDAWTGAIAGTADWLRSEIGCTRIAAFGIGLGGFVACRALMDGAPIDDLVLWATPARGRSLLRELRAFASVAAAEIVDDGPPEPQYPEPDSRGLEVAGFAISQETVLALEQLDLSTKPLPEPTGRRILLLGRDTIEPDSRMRAHLEQSGAEVTVRPGLGFGEMMTHPQFAITPRDVLEGVVAWFEAQPSGQAQRPAPRKAMPAACDHVQLSVDGTIIRERPFNVLHGGRLLAGVLAEPLPGQGIQAECSAVLLSAGAIRRIGPNRMWVETSRRWAARGVPTLRLDVEGVGDAHGDEARYLETAQFYRPELTDQALAAFDALAADGLPERFVVGGLCSGAYWSFHAALIDKRVVGLLLVNLWQFFWSEDVASAHDVHQGWSLLRQGRWREIVRIATEQGRIGRMARTQLRKLLHPRRGSGKSIGEQVDSALDAIRERGVTTLLLLGRAEALEDFLVRTGRIDELERWPNLRLERIPLQDHIFRPVWAQQYVSEVLDRALDQVLVVAPDVQLERCQTRT